MYGKFLEKSVPVRAINEMSIRTSCPACDGMSVRPLDCSTEVRRHW